MKARELRKLKRASAYRAEKIQQRNFEHRIVRLLSAGNERVEAALRGPSVREVQVESGSVCLSQVSLYNAGHRTVRKDARHIIK